MEHVTKNSRRGSKSMYWERVMNPQSSICIKHKTHFMHGVLYNQFKLYNGNAEVCNTITHQPIELVSCSNPLQIQQVFQFRLKIIFFILDLGFSAGDVIMGACFCLFDQVYLALGTNPICHFSLIFLETRLSSQSLEPMIGLLACLQ